MLKGKVAIVTGASSGIGYAIAEHLANEGVKVGLLARRIQLLEDLQTKLECKGAEALAVQCDIAEREQVFKAVEKVRQRFGRIDILVNNAGIGNGSALSNCRVDLWIKAVDVNVNGALHCYAAVLPDMIERKSGHVINISSVYGRQSESYVPIYNGTKFFLQGHSAGIRQELAPFGIKVTVIQPGAVKTQMMETTSDPEVQEYFANHAGFQLAATEPILQPEDVADTVVFALTQKDRVGVNEIMVEPKTVVVNST